MAQVTATAERTVPAPVDQVRAAVADYSVTRPAILTEQYRDYTVTTGGTGAGTTAEWTLQATKKRVRNVKVAVSQPSPDQVVETDANSSMVTTWTVAPAGEAASTVTITTTWTGASGIGGFFEKTFAPKGLARIYGGVLDNLARTVTS
ncbi:MAG: SRPBCC family protein [Pseudonocardia sp.]|nr:SRPBCC family protein [Pseudonocardia sp.]